MSKQSAKLPKEYIHIATIGKTVGIKGDMKFHIHSDFEEQFIDGATFFTQKKEKLTLDYISNSLDLIKIQGIETIEDAKKFTNVKLYSTYDLTRETCHLEEGQYFWFDIIGCEVFEEGEKLGSVTEIERISITDYLQIKTDEKLVKASYNKQFLVPYAKPFLLHVDVEAKKIELSGAKDLLEAS